MPIPPTPLPHHYLTPPWCLVEQQWREAKEGDADVLALGGDDDNGVDDDDDDDLEGSGIPGDELFNRCINATLEAQEVLLIPAPDS